MQNFELITEKINSIKNTNKFIIKAKKEKLQFYFNRIDDINNMDFNKIEKHDFKAEILSASINIKKLDYFSKYKYKFIDKLEIHEFSPELNKIYFRNMNLYIKIPNITSIETAIQYIIVNQSLEQIKSI
jgi:hypothetical protein